MGKFVKKGNSDSAKQSKSNSSSNNNSAKFVSKLNENFTKIQKDK